MPLRSRSALAGLGLVTFAISAPALAAAPPPEPDPSSPATGPGWAFGHPAAEVALAAVCLASLGAAAIPQRRSTWGPATPAPFDAGYDTASNLTGSFVGTGLTLVTGYGMEFAAYRALGVREPALRALRSTLVEAEAVAMTTGITLATKALSGRCRPRAYDGRTCLGEEYDAFPSGHTSSLAAVAGVRFVHAVRSPGPSPWRFLSFGLAEAATIVTGGLRVAAGAHSWDDVLAGWTLGHGVGALLALAHPWEPQRKTPVTVPIQEVPGAAGPTELPLPARGGRELSASWTFHF